MITEVDYISNKGSTERAMRREMRRQYDYRGWSQVCELCCSFARELVGVVDVHILLYSQSQAVEETRILILIFHIRISNNNK